MLFKEIKFIIIIIIIILIGVLNSCRWKNQTKENEIKCINKENMIGKNIVFTFYVRQVYYNDLHIDFMNEKHGNYNSFIVETLEPINLLGNIYHINFQNTPFYNGNPIKVGGKFKFTHEVPDCHSKLGMFFKE